MTTLLITVAVIALFTASIVLNVVAGADAPARRTDREREPSASPLPRQFDWAAFERGFSGHVRSHEDHPT
jgi:hypothetical protein